MLLPPDGQWGGPLPNGSWTGMIGLVSTRVVDVGAASFSVTVERYKLVDFSVSFHQEPTAMLIPPPTEGEKLSVLVRPFRLEVWLIIFALITFSPPLLYAIHLVTLKIMRNYLQLRRANPLRTILEIGHFMIGSLVQESIMSPVNSTTRLPVIFWWFGTLIISNMYTAYMVSYLSSPKYSNVVDSLGDLVQQRKIGWTFRASTALATLFETSNLQVYKDIGEKVTDADMVKSDYEGVGKVLTGKYAFLKEKSYLDVALSDDFQAVRYCRMSLAKELFFRVGVSWIFPKNSETLPAFNYVIIWSIASGLMEKWKMLHWPKSAWCADAISYISQTTNKTRKLTLEDVQGAYLVLCGGILISICGFLAEIIPKYCSRYRPSKQPSMEFETHKNYTSKNIKLIF